LTNYHWIVGEGLPAVLRQEADVDFVGFAKDRAQARAMFELLQPDLVILDLRMPISDGLELIRYLVRKFRARVIVLTAFESEEDLKQSLKAGAKGFLLKKAGRKEIVEAIRVVAQGGNYISTGIASKVANLLWRPELSTRELEVLRLMCEGNSNKEIGSALGITEGTVKKYASCTFQKLNVLRRSEAVSLAIKLGLVQ
jgi:DNA-binding NarL/FixJ family response regulator